MKVDLSLMGAQVDSTLRATQAEARDYDAVWVAETSHDPFLTLALAAQATSRVGLGTNIAVAFARSPMTVAVTANDLQQLSAGRLLLGLGSQIRPHITRRFSMPWSAPAARMKEYVEAVRAIWQAWAEGGPLAFNGRYYQHTLMTPMFDPGPHEYGPAPIYVAAVGPQMTKVAGEVGDGLLCHPFTTPRYLEDVTLPALRAARGSLDGFEVCGTPIVVTGRDEATMRTRAAQARQQLAFYASTPAYRPVLDAHGWGALHEQLLPMSKLGQWTQMGALIDDEMLHTFAVVAEPERMADELARRFGGLLTRCALAPHAADDPGLWAETARRLRHTADSQVIRNRGTV